jgi:hypothetical protein
MFLLMLFFDLLIGVDMICTTLKKKFVPGAFGKRWEK